MTNTERRQKWLEISRYLDEALDLEPGRREAWLKDLADRAPTISQEVRSLLDEREQLGRSPLLDDGATATPVSVGLSGQRIGAYTLESMLGHGGMGTVWLAHRSDGRYEGRAAIKLLSAALVGRPSEQRFVQEGSLLGKLKHPNIAQLLDAGVSPGGQPYLVLEHVEGERIDLYCERLGLGPEARVRLFLDVLAAVAHAHSHLVIHRDLKPSNIFVTSNGEVKLLDFGIAALIGGGESQLTRDIGPGMTPEYAAPEQLLGQPVTTATDVYALGLLLFVLLSGKHPLEPEGKSAPQIARATLDQEAPLLSLVAGDPKRERLLRGDLENIVAKALKKDPKDRYATVERMADDLEHYLAHEPVSARPDSFAYRTAKFVRRHRGGVASALLTALVLIAAVVVTTLQMLEARRQRDAALFQSKRAEYQGRFAYQILSEVGSSGQPVTIRELIAKGVEILEKNYGDDPAFMINALVNISGRYMDLGDTDAEYATLVKAEQLARKMNDPAQIASVQCNTVETELQAGRPAQAAERMKDGFANLAKVPNPSLAQRIDCDGALVKLKWDRGDNAGAIAAARKVVALLETNHMETDVRYNTNVSLLEIMLADSGDTRGAMEWNQRAIAALERAGRGATMSMSALRHNRAAYYYEAGEVRAAYDKEKAVVDDLVAQQGMEGASPYESQRLGYLQVRLEENDAGMMWLEHAVKRAMSEGNRALQISSLLNRARAELLLGRRESATKDTDEADRISQDTGGGLRQRALPGIHQLRAELLMAQGDSAAALKMLDTVLADLNYPADRSSVRLSGVLTLHARTEFALGRYTQALSTAQQALAAAEAHALSADRSADVGAALMELARAQRASGEDVAARASAQRASVSLTNSLGPQHSETRAAVAF